MKGQKNFQNDSISNCKNLADLINMAVEKYPDKTITYIDSSDIDVKTYSETFRDAKNLLGNLQSKGIKSGDIIVVALDKHSDTIPILWACMLGGIIPCPITIKISDNELWKKSVEHISNLFNSPTFIISKDATKWFDENNNLIFIEDLRSVNKNEPTLDRTNFSNIGFLMLSSGSTGLPKAIELSHENILSSLEGKRFVTEINNKDITMNWIAFDHVAALTEIHLLSVFTGATQIQVSPMTIVSNPISFLELINEYRVSHTFTPNFLFRQILTQVENMISNNIKLSNMDFSCLKRIISGGEANSTQTGTQFLNLLSNYNLKRSVIWPAFGMTETCAGSIYSKNFEDELNSLEFGSLGFPVPGLDIRIANEKDIPVKIGETGQLQLHGRLIFKQYFNNVKATEDAFTKDGWFKTGDVGFIDPNSNSLRLVGRSKDSIIINGVNYHLHDLEDVLNNIDGIMPSYVVAFSTREKGADTESLIIFYVPTSKNNMIENQLRINNSIRNTTIAYWGFRPSLILPIPLSLLNKTTLGKIQTSKLKSKYEAGDFSNLISEFKDREKAFIPNFIPPKNINESKIIKLFSMITGINPQEISMDSNFFSLGGTSLETLKLLFEINKLFKMERPLEIIDILKSPTPKKLIDLIFNNEQKEYNPIIPLQETGTNSPVFMIHPGVGEVLVFVNFANLFINDRPIYALRAKGFNNGEQYFQSLDELVNTYVTAIKQQQPKGPYFIAGYSYGGPVSLPIGKKLEEAGDEVYLFVLDAPPVIEHPRGKIDRVESALMLSFFLQFIDKDQLDNLGNYLRSDPKIDPIEYLYSLAPKNRLKELGQTLDSFRKWNDLAFHLSQIGTTYKPEHSVRNVRVFYANPIWGSKEEYLNSKLKLWNNYSNNDVKYIDIKGEHHTIFDNGYVNQFYETFKRELSLAKQLTKSN